MGNLAKSKDAQGDTPTASSEVPSKRERKLKVTKEMKAFNYAFDCGYKKGFERGMFVAHQRIKK